MSAEMPPERCVVELAENVSAEMAALSYAKAIRLALAPTVEHAAAKQKGAPSRTMQSFKHPTCTVAPFNMGAKKGSRGISRCHDAMKAGKKKLLLGCSEGMRNMALSVGSCSVLTSCT